MLTLSFLLVPLRHRQPQMQLRDIWEKLVLALEAAVKTSGWGTSLYPFEGSCGSPHVHSQAALPSKAKPPRKQSLCIGLHTLRCIWRLPSSEWALNPAASPLPTHLGHRTCHILLHLSAYIEASYRGPPPVCALLSAGAPFLSCPHISIPSRGSKKE